MAYPSSITLKDAIVSWYSDLLLHSRSATDTTGAKNKFFLAFGITSPSCPTKCSQVHVSMFYVYICILFYIFPPPFDKAEPSMAFTEQLLSWHRQRGSASPMIVESQLTCLSTLKP
jgi:hypothetical protein